MEKGRKTQCMAMKTDKAYEYGSMVMENNRPYERIKGDAGSIIVEMCVLMPIVITVVFIAINMMFMQINRAAARGEAYAITYNKESYIAGQAGTGDEILEQQIFQSLSEYMNNLDELEVSVSGDKGSRSLFYSVGKRKTVVKYEENHLYSEDAYREYRLYDFSVTSPSHMMADIQHQITTYIHQIHLCHNSFPYSCHLLRLFPVSRISSSSLILF